MENEKVTALRSIVLAMEDVRKKLDYSSRPEYIRGCCECIEKLAVAYTYIARMEKTQTISVPTEKDENGEDTGK